MTRAEWLARCATAYDMGLANDDALGMLRLYSDVALRWEHYLATGDDYQYGIALKDLRLRVQYAITPKQTREGGYLYSPTLANSRDGYGAVTLAALLGHPCPICACDPNAWHTRYGFCNHAREAREKPESPPVDAGLIPLEVAARLLCCRCAHDSPAIPPGGGYEDWIHGTEVTEEGTTIPVEPCGADALRKAASYAVPA